MSQKSGPAQMERARGGEEPRLRAIIDHVADGMVIGGTLSVTSRVGKGTTFTLWLPRSLAEARTRDGAG